MTDYSHGYRAGLEAAAEALRNPTLDGTLPWVEAADLVESLPVPGEAPELNPHAICGTCGTVRERHGSGGLGHDFNETPPPVRAPAPPAEAPDWRKLLRDGLDIHGSSNHAPGCECEWCAWSGMVANALRHAAQPEGQAAPIASRIPADLMQRILAALESVNGGMDMSCTSLAAELRAAAAAPGGEDAEALLRECESFARSVKATQVMDDGSIRRAAEALLNRLAARAREILAELHAATAPVDMLLHCPVCGRQHIDAPEPGTDWTNPPHRSHKCAACGVVWRPADVPTNGVATIKTRGSADTVAICAQAHAAAPGGKDAEALLRESREMVDVLGEGHAAELVTRIDAWLAARAMGSR